MLIEPFHALMGRLFLSQQEALETMKGFALNIRKHYFYQTNLNIGVLS